MRSAASKYKAEQKADKRVADEKADKYKVSQARKTKRNVVEENIASVENARVRHQAILDAAYGTTSTKDHDDVLETSPSAVRKRKGSPTSPKKKKKQAKLSLLGGNWTWLNSRSASWIGMMRYPLISRKRGCKILKT